MSTENNAQKYLIEIPQYQAEAKKFAWVSLPFLVACGYFVIDSLVTGNFEKIISGHANNVDKVFFAVKTIVPFYLWHELFMKAERQVSRMKQAVRDYRFTVEGQPEPIRYSKTVKVINFFMPLYDNSPLPPEG